MAEIGILGSYWTLAVGADPSGAQHCPFDFRMRVEAAARAGFTGMGFWHADLVEILKTYSLQEMARILNGNGIVDIELEWLLNWYCTDERRIESDATRALLFEASQALSARHIKVGDLDNDCAELPEMTEHFAKLCGEASDVGATILFEMLPAQLSKAASLDAALALVRESGARNAGIMLDNLHLLRCGATREEMIAKIKPSDLIGVEINDGYLATPLNFVDSVINKRLLPGDGEFDIDGFLRAVWEIGYNGPIGVEVLNEYIRRWPLDLAADEAFQKTRGVVDNSWRRHQEIPGSVYVS